MLAKTPHTINAKVNSLSFVWFRFFSSLGLFGYDAAIDVRHLVSDAV